MWSTKYSVDQITRLTQILNGRKLGVLKLGQRYVQVLNFLSICAEVHAQTVFIIANDGHSVSFYIMN